MPETKFKTGNVVRLKSDTEENTPMTVEAYYWEIMKQGLFTFDLLPEENKHQVKCVWRDKQDVPHVEWYSDEALVLISI